MDIDTSRDGIARLTVYYEKDGAPSVQLVIDYSVNSLVFRQTEASPRQRDITASPIRAKVTITVGPGQHIDRPLLPSDAARVGGEMAGYVESQLASRG